MMFLCTIQLFGVCINSNSNNNSNTTIKTKKSNNNIEFYLKSFFVLNFNRIVDWFVVNEVIEHLVRSGWLEYWNPMS